MLIDLFLGVMLKIIVDMFPSFQSAMPKVIFVPSQVHIFCHSTLIWSTTTTTLEKGELILTTLFPLILGDHASSKKAFD